MRHCARHPNLRLVLPAILAAALGPISAATGAGAQALTISVFGLFRPTTLVIRPGPGSGVLIRGCGREVRIAGSTRADVHLTKDSLELSAYGQNAPCIEFDVEGRDASPFTLEVPGKLARRFRGALTMRPLTDARHATEDSRNNKETSSILAAVSMDLETAVASVVEAESPPGAPSAALEAQAIVARSFYVAERSRHATFDFCDTTHCQFLRDVPRPDSPAALATATTRGLILAYRGAAVAAYYSARCGGRTRALTQAGIGAYPYYAVECAWCLRHPAASGGDRRLPYSDQSTHGLGLCQSGAAAMARAGATPSEILAHYFPNTTITNVRRLADALP